MRKLLCGVMIVACICAILGILLERPFDLTYREDATMACAVLAIIVSAVSYSRDRT